MRITGAPAHFLSWDTRAQILLYILESGTMEDSKYSCAQKPAATYYSVTTL